jgi:hypothetical protein
MRALPAADTFRPDAIAPPSSSRNTWLNFPISSLIPFVMDSRLNWYPLRSLNANGEDNTSVGDARASGRS